MSALGPYISSVSAVEYMGLVTCAPGQLVNMLVLYRRRVLNNVAGEILTWTSLYVVAGVPQLWYTHPWIAVSPGFTAILLLYVSGVQSYLTNSNYHIKPHTYNTESFIPVSLHHITLMSSHTSYVAVCNGADEHPFVKTGIAFTKSFPFLHCNMLSRLQKSS